MDRVLPVCVLPGRQDDGADVLGCDWAVGSGCPQHFGLGAAVLLGGLVGGGDLAVGGGRVAEVGEFEGPGVEGVVGSDAEVVEAAAGVEDGVV